VESEEKSRFVVSQNIGIIRTPQRSSNSVQDFILLLQVCSNGDADQFVRSSGKVQAAQRKDPCTFHIDWQGKIRFGPILQNLIIGLGENMKVLCSIGVGKRREMLE
jgi:hypothetical protein